MTRILVLVAVALASVVATAGTSKLPAGVGADHPHPAPAGSHLIAWLLLAVLLGLLAAAAVHTMLADKENEK